MPQIFISTFFVFPTGLDENSDKSEEVSESSEYENITFTFDTEPKPKCLEGGAVDSSFA